MSLEKIRETVIEASEAKAREIKSSAEKQAREKLETQKEYLRRDLEHQFETRLRQMEDEFSRKMALLEGNIAKELLQAKNKAVRAIFDRARDTVLSWDPEKYARSMTTFLAKITADRKGLVRIHHDDKKIFTDILREINRGRDESIRLELDETHFLRDRGGFIFASSDFEVDATLATIFEDLERSILPEFSRELVKI